MDVGSKIREARKRKGLSQIEVAKAAKIAVNSLRLYESNKRQPRIEQLRAIADAIGIDVYYFLRDDSPPSERLQDEAFQTVYNTTGLNKNSVQVMVDLLLRGSAGTMSDKRTLIDILNAIISDEVNMVQLLGFVRLATAPFVPQFNAREDDSPRPIAEQREDHKDMSEVYKEYACDTLSEMIDRMNKHINGLTQAR